MKMIEILKTIKRIRTFIIITLFITQTFSVHALVNDTASEAKEKLIKKASTKQTIQSLYIPLADHYAAIVAYESYRDKMTYADYQIKQMESWMMLRAYYQSGKADMAYVMSPMAMDMYYEDPHFKWIGLMHRDGNALAINDLLKESVSLAELRYERKPDNKVANAIVSYFQENQRPIEIAVPDLLSTHVIVLYQYLKQHGLSLSLSANNPGEVLAVPVAPAKSPAFINAKSSRAQASGFEQSLPWADVVETTGMGHVAWYSKDVLPWLHGHIDCIVIASQSSLQNKFQAVYEVMQYIHQAGADIEQARDQGGAALENIIQMIRKHVPEHSKEAIIASLDPQLRVINYKYLNVDKEGIKSIMELAIEAKVMKKSIDIDKFIDTRFMNIQSKSHSIFEE